MKHLLRLFMLFAILFGITMTSCKKDDDDSSTSTPSGPSSTTNTTIVGVVYDDGHSPLGNVKVSVGNNVYTTQWDGSFIFNNVQVDNERFLVKFEKSNYFTTVRTEKTKPGGITRIQVGMIYKSTSQQITTTNGGDYNGTGLSIHFPAGLNYVDENGNTYNGNITVSAEYLDASDDDYSMFVPGGDNYGLITSASKSFFDNQGVYFEPVSGAIIELTDGNGNLINLASNNDSVVTVRLNIPSEYQSTAPDSADSWYNGDQLAYASNEGSGRKEGGTYVCEVEHFSYWFIAMPQQGVAKIKGHVTDDSGNAIEGVRVTVGQTYAVTDENGYYEREVPAGVAGITVTVLPTDYNSYTSTPVVITNALTDGEEYTADITITIPAGDMRTVTGRLVNCAGNTVSGTVTIAAGTFVAQTYTSNGVFSIKVPTTSTSLNVNISGNNTEITKYVTPMNDPEDLGDIVLCPPPANSNKVTIGGTTYSDFNQSSAVYYTSYGELSITFEGPDGNVYLTISDFNGVGDYYLTQNQKTGYADINVDGQYYYADTNTVVTISTYESVGGRVIGTFSGNTTTGETLSGQFNAYREEDQDYK